MLGIGVQERSHVAGSLQETFVSLSVPRHPLTRKLLKCWHRRPTDGFLIGHNLPLHDRADPLSQTLAWQPTGDGQDFIVRQVGPGLSGPFNDDIIGCRMSDLISPELFAYLRHIFRQFTDMSHLEILDICQSHNGFDYLHYEMALFPASAGNQEVWLVTGLYYF